MTFLNVSKALKRCASGEQAHESLPVEFIEGSNRNTESLTRIAQRLDCWDYGTISSSCANG